MPLCNAYLALISAHLSVTITYFVSLFLNTIINKFKIIIIIKTTSYLG